MTQALYAYMNNKAIKKKKFNPPKKKKEKTKNNKETNINSVLSFGDLPLFMWSAFF
jgi:hypothetical protein